MSDETEVKAMFGSSEAELGPIVIPVNNAGISKDDWFLDRWDRNLDVRPAPKRSPRPFYF